MKKWIHAVTKLPDEAKVLAQIPKKYKEHIESIDISLSDDYNDRGQQLINYTVTWDNEDEHTFQNLSYMLSALKENTVDGYYVQA